MNVPAPAVFFFLVATACASGPNRPTRHHNAQPPDLLLRFERTGCYGSCPAYVIEVDRGGAVYYEGVAHVRKCGRAAGRVDNPGLAALRDAIARADFARTPEHCCDCMTVTDQPSAIITVADGGAQKTITDYHGCDAAPRALRELEDALDAILQSERWVGKDERGSCSFW
jgi:hypothetical protein